ncbi:MAG: 23S rRNA (uracil(1939)-C(5))-methyltransferase RlmD [Clostridiaceae bacterium]
MSEQITVKKNEDYIIDITSSGHEGEGIGKIDNFTVFVSGALKGEKVKVKIIKLKKTYGYGKLLEIIEPSSCRAEESCKIYKNCGGCQLQHLTYQGQLDFKTERVKDVLERIGGLKVSDDESEVKLYNTLGMDNPYRYRNKVQLPVGESNGEIKIGFYATRSHNIIDMKECLIQHESGDKLVEVVKLWMKEFKIKPYNEETHSGIVRHVMVRKGFKTGELMIVIVTKGSKLPYKEELIQLLKENFEELTSVIQNINDKKTNVILGLENRTLYGKENISDYIGEFKFNISPLSFFQVNPYQTEVLYNKALEYAGLTGDEVVFDAYCGTGTISLFLSKKAKKVYGVEIIKEAIDNAKENAVQNNVDNVEFFVGKCEEEIPKLIEKGVKADVVVVDPPRKGCEKSLLEALVKINPQRIVYVSCDPATLARDLKILEEMDYKTVQVQPVDMFPQTAHVETVALIEKK